MIDQDFFRTVPDLSGLDKEQIETLVSHLDVASYEDGFVFIEEGKPGDDAYFLLEGEVSVTRMKGEDKRVKELNRMVQREIFGIISLIDFKERTSTCRALGEVTVAKLSQQAFVSLCQQSPAIAYQLHCIIARQISRDLKFFADEIRSIIFSDNAAEALKGRDGMVYTDAYKGVERRSKIFSGFNGPERRKAEALSAQRARQ